jgi:diaminohydroxyphosphoribosylaminopyrimidine deaminase / 5-amino-6-(5-phosphoribosylamino)uracil reductase
MSQWNGYMRIALALAAKGCGYTTPNPMVGAVLVKNGEIVSRGWHKKFGGAHAEADCLSQVSAETSKGATIILNLEPCSHYGKTPPCAELLVKRGITRVVAGMRDPNPAVSGRGFDLLGSAGIEIVSDILRGECEQLNRSFVSMQTKKRPWITLKWAQSLDGRISRQIGASTRISTVKSSKEVHRLRVEHPGILIGIGTAIADNPILDSRLADGPNPHRYLIDPDLDLRIDSALANSAHSQALTVFCRAGISTTKLKPLIEMGVVIVQHESVNGEIGIDSVVSRIARDGIDGLLVEGGAGVFSRFLNSGLADEIICITATRMFGSGQPLLNLPVAANLRLCSEKYIDQDSWRKYELIRNGDN